MTATVADALVEVRGRIAAAAARVGRDPAAIRVVAVTKGVAVDRVREAVTAGIADIGENRVQEAQAKRAEIGNCVRWHLLGHLQTNKAGLAARVFDSVHSIDSARIAAALARHRTPGAVLPVMVEVDLTGIDGRTGVAFDDADQLAEICASTPGLRLDGLMTIAPPGSTVSARECFARVRGLRDALELRLGAALPELSMGMSDDFEIAVEEGATIVRIGRVIFGFARGSP